MKTQLNLTDLSKKFISQNKHKKIYQCKALAPNISQKTDSNVFHQNLQNRENFQIKFTHTKSIISQVIKKDAIRLDGRDQIERLFLQVKAIQEQKNNIIEEIEFFLTNFQYIIELFQQNMIKNLSEKINLIIQDKNKIILSLNEKIEKFESQKDNFQQINKESIKHKRLIYQLQTRLLDLQRQNRQIKEKLFDQQKIIKIKNKNFKDLQQQLQQTSNNNLLKVPQKNNSKIRCVSKNMSRQLSKLTKSSTDLLCSKIDDCQMQRQIQNIEKVRAKILSLKNQLLKN